MKVLTQSSLRTHRACPRKYRHSYVDMAKPVKSTEGQWYGTAWHVVREAWWKHQSHNEAGLALFHHIESQTFESEYEKDIMTRRLTAMLIGYHTRWATFVAGLNVLGVEQKFSIPLVNPRTRLASRTYTVEGMFDSVVEENGELWVVEEKTAKGDLEPDSTYWRRLEIDPQSSTYYDAVEKMYGRPCAGIMYFVNVKPALRPKKATAEVKYNKDGVTPRAGQNLADETPDEFMSRLLAAIAKEPERYYHMVRVARLERDIEESLADVWDTAKEIRHAELSGVWRRNPDACIQYNSVCPYFPVCTRRANIDDPSMYIQSTTPHSELA